LHYKTNKTFPNQYVSIIAVLMGSNQQYVNARYIVSVPCVGFEPISPGKIQGSTIELQRQNTGLFWVSGLLIHQVKTLKLQISQTLYLWYETYDSP